MKLVRPPVRRDAGAARDGAVIPLINVVFLMLIFFMTIGRLVPPSLLSVEPPRAQLGAVVTGQGAENLVLSVGADGRLAINGRAVVAEDLDERLKHSVTGQVEPELTIRADAALKSGELRALLERLRVIGFHHVRLVTTAKPLSTDALVR